MSGNMDFIGQGASGAMLRAPGGVLLSVAAEGDLRSDLPWYFVAFLALVAGYLFFNFIREHQARSVLAVAAAIVAHVAFILLLAIDLQPYGCGMREQHEPPAPYEVAVVTLDEPEPPPEKPEEKKPDPEPEEEEPEVIPEVKEPEPKPEPKKTPKKVAPAPVSETPVADEPPPPPLRFDLSQTSSTSTSGVSVQIGEPGGSPGGKEGGVGKPGSKGKGSVPADADTTGEAAWAPASEIYVKTLPETVRVDKIQCPATQELGIEGVVILKVQVQKDGAVRSVKVSKGIGNGCDAIASKALRKAKFKAAVGTNGQPVDYELRYEYEFRLDD